jgi:uncharacterized protein YbaR (Trm112 family)
MLTPELLAVLRCPMDPRRQAVLQQDEEHLTCPECGLRFGIRDGFPNLIVEDAELPVGCTRLEDLAAKHGKP